MEVFDKTYMLLTIYPDGGRERGFLDKYYIIMQLAERQDIGKRHFKFQSNYNSSKEKRRKRRWLQTLADDQMCWWKFIL